MAYSQKEKTKLLAKFSQIRTSGKTALQAASSIGVSYMTLLRWERANGKAASLTQSGKRSRAGTTDQATNKMSLTTPGGYRIEANSTTDIIKVLMALKQQR